LIRRRIRIRRGNRGRDNRRRRVRFFFRRHFRWSRNSGSGHP
jgi:hypothetical protein